MTIGRMTAATAIAGGWLLSAAAWGQQVSPAEPYIEALRQSLAGTEQSDLALEAIASIPDDAAAPFMDWFEAHAHEMPADYLYAYAQRVFPLSQKAGIGWFFAGRTRIFYNAFRCTDPSVFETIAIRDAQMAAIVISIEQNPSLAADLGERALSWEQSYPAPSRSDDLLKFCLTGQRGRQLAIDQGKVAQGEEIGTGPDGTRYIKVPMPDVTDPADWVIPPADHPAAREEARNVTRRVIANLRAAGEAPETQNPPAAE